jgi:hypothetical protein
MARNKEENRAINEITSEREVWCAIRYLDPGSDQREGEIAAIVSVAVIFTIGIGCVLLLLRAL